MTKKNTTKRGKTTMKRKFQIPVLVPVLLMGITVLGKSNQAISMDQMIIPNPRIQNQISHLLSVKNVEESLQEISKLKEMDKIEILIQQLIYFQVATMKNFNMKNITSNEMEERMNSAYFVLSKLLTLDEKSMRLTSPSAQILISAIIPYLGTEDTDLKKQLERMLKMIDYCGIDKVDYSEYKSFIEKRKDNLPEGLIKYMFHRSPGEAFLTLAQIFIHDPEERRSIIQSEEIIEQDFRKRYLGPVESSVKISSKAVEAFNKLSKYEYWWVRLYFAEILRKDPYAPLYVETTLPEIIKSLEQDGHPLVKETMAEMKREKQIKSKREYLWLIISYLTQRIEEFFPKKDPILVDKAKQLRYTLQNRETEETEENLFSLISILRKKFLEEKESLIFFVNPLEEPTNEYNILFKKFLVKEFLSDPGILKVINREEKEELINILNSLSKEIPEAEKVLKLLKGLS